MSIQSEIDRINSNVQSALNAVADTGVSVPEGANSDNLPAAVSALANEKQDKLTFDAAPTENSTNPVTSGGVYTALANKLNKAGDGSSVTAAFTAASSRANIATGEKLSVLFGKIAKWLSDLGSLAFKSTVAKTDLASDVQTSLGKADSALQSVTKSDVGLGNVDNVKQYSASNPPPYPVTSVNGQTGDVTVSGGVSGKTATLTSSGWIANSVFGFEQTVSVTGVTTSATQVITVDVDLSLTDANANAEMLNAWALVAQCPAKQNSGSITFYAVEKPNVSISLAIGVGG